MARKREEKSARQSHGSERKSRSEAVAKCPQQDFVSLRQQLATIGLDLRDIAGDGNCLFAALADQLDGTPRGHLKHRQAVVQYMRSHRDDFEPFVEDNVPFEKHLLNMSEIGTYGGNGCIVAFARLHSVDVVIHQLNTPMWQIKCEEGKEARHQMHISYHNGDHYNSIRRIGDHTTSPPNIKLTNPDSFVAKKKAERKAKEEDNGYSSGDGKMVCAQTSYGLPEDIDDTITDTEQMIMDRTRCYDLLLIRREFIAHNYDFQETVEFITNFILHEHKGEYPLTTSPLWSFEGTGTRIFGEETAQAISKSDAPKKSLESIQSKLKNQSHLSNSKRKELKKKLRKQQASDRKKGGSAGASNDYDQCGAFCEDDSDIIIVKDLACLSI